jgi:hypothetical protein
MEKSNTLPETDYLMLRRARGNLRDFLGIGPLTLDAKQRAAAANNVVKQYDGKPLTEKSKLERELIEDYTVAGEWFQQLKDEADKLGLPAPIIVMMPTTDKYQQFHDQFVEKPKYADVHRQIIEAIEAAGLRYIDAWSAPRIDYKRFRDPYHLHPDGQAWFTKRLVEEIRPLLAATTKPTTAPAAP